MSKLEQLFINVLEKSRILRSQNHNFDGLSFWQPIKNELSVDIKAKSWKKIDTKQNTKLIHTIMSLPEIIVDGYGNKTLIESNHFIIQQIRIPTTEDPNLRKIIQIALNIGQWLGFPDKKLIKELDYYNTELTELSRYITKADIANISKQIDPQTILNINSYLDSYKI